MEIMSREPSGRSKANIEARTDLDKLDNVFCYTYSAQHILLKARKHDE